MATNYAVRINAPSVADRKAGITVTTAASTYISLLQSGSTIAVARIWIKSTAKTYLIFTGAATATPTTTDMYLTADVDYVFDIPAGTTRFRVKGAAAGTAAWAVVA